MEICSKFHGRYYTIIAEENRSVLRPYSMEYGLEYALDKASHKLRCQIGAAGGMCSLIADSRVSPLNNHQGMNGALKLGLEPGIGSWLC
jgi:hypothetical protein